MSENSRLHRGRRFLYLKLYSKYRYIHGMFKSLAPPSIQHRVKHAVVCWRSAGQHIVFNWRHGLFFLTASHLLGFSENTRVEEFTALQLNNTVLITGIPCLCCWEAMSYKCSQFPFDSIFEQCEQCDLRNILWVTTGGKAGIVTGAARHLKNLGWLWSDWIISDKLFVN